MNELKSVESKLVSSRSNTTSLLAWRYNPNYLALVGGLVFALLLAAVIGWWSFNISQDYYKVAPYQYDSATYRLGAVQFYIIQKSQGVLSALVEALKSKDSLDNFLRLALFPTALIKTHGHLVVLLPFLALFVFLLVWYVFKRTQSLTLGFTTSLLLLGFAFVYKPYTGIADYWKDNLAVWLMGSAVLAWLLADKLAFYRWSLLCSTLLGMLVMQRSAAAVYTAMLFLPLFGWASFQRIRQDGWRRGLLKIGVFILPAAVLGLVVVSLQWQLLYSYYFTAGYAYGTPASVAQLLWDGIISSYGFGLGGFAPATVGILGLICVALITNWRQRLSDIVAASWLVVGLPLLIIGTSAAYFGFYVLWPILLIIWLATLLPDTPRVIKKSFLTAGLFILALGLASFQYNVTSAGTRTLIQNLAPYRQMYTTIGDLLVAQAEPRRYGIFFSELGEPLGNQLYFEKGVTLNAPTAFTSVHDSYYRFRYGNLSSQQIFEKNINELEKYPKALAFAYCRPQDALKEPNFVGNQNPLAAGLAIKTSDYLLNSNHWLALKQFESPYGCLYAYQYNPSELSATAKWQQLNFDSPAQASIPLALAISPDVVMFDYSSLYPAEFANGVYSQWLPSGHDKAGLNVTLFSNQSRTVFLETRAIAGPSRIDSVRTLVLNDNGKISKAVINGKANLRIEIQLQAGLNQLQFYVEEPADKPPDSSDQRQLLLLLQSPHLVRA